MLIEILVFSVILLSVSIYFFLKKIENEFYAVTLLILSGLLLRIFVSTDPDLHEWDERYHAVVAKNIINHPLKPTLYDEPLLPYDYKNWDSNNIWVHKQPLTLWAIALSIFLFGAHSFSVRIPSIILSTICIWLTFRIAKPLFGYRVAFLSAVLFSINGLVLDITSGRAATDHVDLFFLFFIELGIFLSVIYDIKRRVLHSILIGSCIGAAILTKWLPALLVYPVWLFLVYDSKQFGVKAILIQSIIIISVAVIVALPWQIFIFSQYPLEAKWESNYNFLHLTTALEGHSGSIFYYLNMIRINYGELVYLPLLWFIWKVSKSSFDQKKLAILVWLIIPLIFFSVVKTKMSAYILFTCPAIFMITSVFVVNILEDNFNWRMNYFKTLIVSLFLLLPIRYSLERIKPIETIRRKPVVLTELKSIHGLDNKKTVLLNFPHPIEAMFFTNVIAYSYAPDQQVIDDLVKQGYSVIFCDKQRNK